MLRLSPLDAQLNAASSENAMGNDRDNLCVTVTISPLVLPLPLFFC